MKGKNLVKALCLPLMLAAGGAVFGNSQAETPAGRGEPTVIRFGMWSTGTGEGDRMLGSPSWRDPVTGSLLMSAEEMRVALIAEQKVLDELNVKIEWVVVDNIDQDTLRTVLAGDPCSDIQFVNMSHTGNLMNQNVIQDLTPFVDIFKNDSDASWMLYPQIFDKYYYLKFNLDQVMGWPLVFNIDYVEAVPSLQDGNGETIYPTTLYKQGTWTWSVWKDYLVKLKAYYANRPAPMNPEINIRPYWGDYREAVQNLLHTTGNSVYIGKGVDHLASQEVIDAVAFFQTLVEEDLQYSYGLDPNSASIKTGPDGWTRPFGRGESVFTDINWPYANEVGTTLSSLGYSMGIIPYPRPDWLAADDPRYQQISIPGAAFCVLKGVSAEKARLGLEAWKLYFLTRYREMANSDRAMDFLKTSAESNAIAHGIDVFHPKIGKDLLEIYTNYSSPTPNEICETLGIYWGYLISIVGQAIHGINNSPQYPVAIQQKLPELRAGVESTERALGLRP